MRVASAGHVMFALTMIALGILGLVSGNFTPVWEPVPRGVPARELMVYACALISLGCGAGLLFRRTAVIASRVLFAALLLWLIVLRAPRLFVAPSSQDSWSGFGETAVMVSGAWVLYAWFANEWDRRVFAFATGERGVRIARTLFGLALLPFGEAHLRYVTATARLVPSWLPLRVALVYVTGIAFIAAGVAVLSGVCARLVASLAALQIGLFTVLVWVPIMAAGVRDPFMISESILSWAITTGAWVVADSYRRERWIGKAASRISSVTRE